jgi:SAM-dependent methyltransferase
MLRLNHRLVPLSRAELEDCYCLNQLQKFEAVLNRNGYSMRQFSSILEFGCRYGRLTRYLFDLVPQARVFGCDILKEGILDCRRKYPRGVFTVNDPAPPLNFEDAQFDLIYSYSVFTHLSESNHAAWLKELARLLRPGGVMLHTTHSYEYLTRAAMFSPESIEKYRLPEPFDAFIRAPHPYHYVVDNPSTPEYGLTIISKEYAMTRWPQYSGLALCDYAEGAIESYPEGCHDIVMLVKEPR